MKTPKNRILVLALALAALPLESFLLQTARASIWIPSGLMTTARYGYTATLLPNGKVLAAGGGYHAGFFSSAELYDPATSTMPLGSNVAV